MERRGREAGGEGEGGRREKMEGRRSWERKKEDMVGEKEGKEGWRERRTSEREREVEAERGCGEGAGRREYRII